LTLHTTGLQHSESDQWSHYGQQRIHILTLYAKEGAELQYIILNERASSSLGQSHQRLAVQMVMFAFQFS